MGQYVVIQSSRAGAVAVWPAQYLLLQYSKEGTMASLVSNPPGPNRIMIQPAIGGSLFIAETLQAAITHATILRDQK